MKKVDKVINISGLIIAIISLLVSIFAFYIPFSNVQKEAQKNQASKVIAYIGDEQNECSGQSLSGWTVCVKNTSEAPIYDVKARVTPLELTIDNASLISSTESLPQVNPDKDLKISSYSSSVAGKEAKVEKIRISYSFKDSAGIEWYRIYELSGLSDPSKSNFANIVELTQEKPGDWSQLSGME